MVESNLLKSYWISGEWKSSYILVHEIFLEVNTVLKLDSNRRAYSLFLYWLLQCCEHEIEFQWLIVYLGWDGEGWRNFRYMVCLKCCWICGSWVWDWFLSLV